jgi:hypothetical protein
MNNRLVQIYTTIHNYDLICKPIDSINDVFTIFKQNLDKYTYFIYISNSVYLTNLSDPFLNNGYIIKNKEDTVICIKNIDSRVTRLLLEQSMETLESKQFIITKEFPVTPYTTSHYYNEYLIQNTISKYYNKKNIRIGILMRSTNYYSNGCSQNCIFLWMTLNCLGYDCELITENNTTENSILQLPIVVKHLENPETYQLFIYGTTIPSDTLNIRVKNLNIPAVVFHPFNSLDAAHIPAYTYNTFNESIPLFESHFGNIASHVWITENYKIGMPQYIESLNKNVLKSVVVPLTWYPLFVSPKEKLRMYTSIESNTIDIVIIEPNNSYCKSAWFPLVIAEHFHQKTNRLGNVLLYCTPSSAKANKMIDCLSISSKIKKCQRIPITTILSNIKNNSVFVFHQIHSELNYSYYDIISSGYRLLHNTNLLKSDGYYETLDDACKLLISYSTTYELNAMEIQQRKQLIESLNPLSIKNRDTFQTILSNILK